MQAQLPAASVLVSQESLAAQQGTLEEIYSRVNPSVVNIQVVVPVSADSLQLPEGFTNPFGQDPSNPQSENPVQQGLGSGFILDTEGHVVTNNHVVDGASQITVNFSDGSSYPATVVGKDANSDLAVIKVEAPADLLKPVTLADSDQLKVGQMAIAIGNPYGLEGTMTVGIISALGRSLPVDMQSAAGGSYTIPDVIQTDAPINPGNSGGVLLNDLGQVTGVTSAIESVLRRERGDWLCHPGQHRPEDYPRADEERLLPAPLFRDQRCDPVFRNGKGNGSQFRSARYSGGNSHRWKSC